MVLFLLMIETRTGYICPAYNQEVVVEGPDVRPLDDGTFTPLTPSLTITFRRKNNPVALAVTAGKGMTTISESDEWEGDMASLIHSEGDAKADLMDMHAYLGRRVLRKAIARQLDENCQNCRVVNRCDYSSQLYENLVSLAAE